MKRKLPYYIDFIIPILEILEITPYKTSEEIEHIILNNYDYDIDDIISDNNQIKRAIYYLKVSEFISEDNSELKNTTKGSELINNSKKTDEQKIRVIQKFLTNEFYKIPSSTYTDYFYRRCLSYLKNYPKHPVNRKDMVNDIIDKMVNFSSDHDDIMELRTAKGRYLIYTRVNLAIFDLSVAGSIENTDEGYCLTKDGKEFLKDPDNIFKNVKKRLSSKKSKKSNSSKSNKKSHSKNIVNEKINKGHNKPHSQVKFLTTDAYETLILKLLSNMNSYSDNEIISEVKSALLPESDIPREISDIIDHKIKNALTSLINKNSIKLNDDKYYLTDDISEYKQDEESLPITLIHRIHDESPRFLEHLVLDVLLHEYFDGVKPHEGKVTGNRGDKGIDGEISLDRMSRKKVYFQTKRYDDSNKVGSHDIRDFSGALSRKNASEGIFVTTSEFTKGAYDEADAAPIRITLINGERLAKLMIANRIGIKSKDIIDDKYFNKN